MATGLAPWLRGKGGEGRERGREVALRPDGRAVCERWPPPDVPFWAPSHRLATQPSAQHSPSAACTSSSFLPRVLVPWCLSPRLGAEGLPGPCRPVDFVGSLGLGSALSCSLDASAPPPLGGEGPCGCGPPVWVLGLLQTEAAFLREGHWRTRAPAQMAGWAWRAEAEGWALEKSGGAWEAT